LRVQLDTGTFAARLGLFPRALENGATMLGEHREPSGRGAWIFTAAISAAVVVATVGAYLALSAFDDAQERGRVRSLQSLAAEEAVLAELYRAGRVNETFVKAESENIADQRKDLEAQR